MHRYADKNGFTVLELTVAILIIGLIVTFAVATAGKMIDRAQFASCVSNQRSIANAVLIFIMETQTEKLDVGIEDFSVAGWVPKKVGECPSSGDDNYADYKIKVKKGTIDRIKCLIEPKRHHWKIP